MSDIFPLFSSNYVKEYPIFFSVFRELDPSYEYYEECEEMNDYGYNDLSIIENAHFDYESLSQILDELAQRDD